jgi:SAM-dependent methyltransferase
MTGNLEPPTAPETPPSAPRTAEVIRRFDAMAGSYDELEPWYEHLYARLHAILGFELARTPAVARRRALDAGCGTGFQTALLAGAGYAAHGVDVAGAALAVARARLPAAGLARASVEALPYRDASFDAVVCLGSTLSFVEDPARALAEMGRVLRGGGWLLLECEHKWSLDLAWMGASALLGDALGYGVSLRALRRALGRPLDESCVIDYPDYGPLRLFTRGELARLLGAAGLAPERAWGIHSATGLLPSTLLHRPRLPAPARPLYAALRAADRWLERTPIARALASSSVVLARKGTAAS